MDEYERIEEELSQVYGMYVVKIRCLAYLEEQLEELEKVQKTEFAVSGFCRVRERFLKHVQCARCCTSLLLLRQHLLLEPFVFAPTFAHEGYRTIEM